MFNKFIFHLYLLFAFMIKEDFNSFFQQFEDPLHVIEFNHEELQKKLKSAILSLHPKFNMEQTQKANLI